MSIDPLYQNILPVYCVCLYELGNYNELFSCANNLMENYPDSPLSHFTAGVYNFLAKRYENAHKFFMQANKIDRNFIYSWIGSGHANAIEDKSDQVKPFEI